MVRFRFVLLVGMALAACGDGPATESPDSSGASVIEPEPTGELVGLPYGVEQWQRVCARGYGDAISAKFCAGNAPPAISSLDALIRFLNGSATPTFLSKLVMTGHSTGVSVRTVTPLNPRFIFMTATNYGTAPDLYMTLSFARGEPLVELVANDPVAQTLRFFLLRFHPACESTPSGCNWADLLTPSIELGWTSYTLYDDETLKNTTIDCLSCHQPAGPGTKKMLRMQELSPPWTHWFDEGSAGLALFLNTHKGSDFSGGGLVRQTPDALESLVVAAGFFDQPNAFESLKIKYEVLDDAGIPTWQALYDKAVTGQAIPPPYYGELQTDPSKMYAMSAAYISVMNGSLAREQLPDIRATLSDAALPAMSIRPKTGLDGRGILVHMCGRCHNSRLDQALTRARFNVEALDTMSRDEKDLAIERLRLPDTDQHKMPPVRFHELSQEERELAISALAN